MTPENRHDARDEKGHQAPPSRVPPDRTVLALLRVGTGRCRLAAALVAVMVGLMAQTAGQAFAQARQTVLYLDAPTVSKERASRAGEVADTYASPGSPASRETLAWVAVPVRPVDVSTPPADAEAAFASVTAPDAEGGSGVTLDAALRAGEVMLAQIDDAAPTEAGGEDGEMAAGAVRPQLGDGTQAPESARVAEPAQPPDAGTPEHASTPDAVAPEGGPNGDAGLVVPAPSSDGQETEEPSTELAAVPSDTGAPPEPAFGTADEPYGPTGPISDAGLTAEEEPAPDAGERPYPAEPSLASEPSAEEDEFAEAARVPTPAPPAAPTSVDTGPTIERGQETALVPVSTPQAGEEGPAPAPPAEDGGAAELAHADPAALPAETPDGSFSRSDAPRPAPAESARDAGGRQIEIVVRGDEPPGEAPPGTPPTEVGVQEETIVRERETDESAPETTPADRGDTNSPPEEGTGPPEGEAPSQPPAAQVPTAPARDEGNDPEPETDTDEGEGQGSSQATHEPPAGDASDPTDQTETAPSPEGGATATPPTIDGPPEVADQPASGESPPAQPPVDGEAAPPDETGTHDAPQAPADTDHDPAGDEHRPPHGHNAKDTRDRGRPDPGTPDHRDADRGRPADPMERIERLEKTDGGGEAVQQKVQDAAEQARQERIAERRAARGSALVAERRAAIEKPAAEEAALREQRRAERRAAQPSAEAQTYAQPALRQRDSAAARPVEPAVHEPVYQQPVRQTPRAAGAQAAQPGESIERVAGR